MHVRIASPLLCCSLLVAGCTPDPTKPSSSLGAPTTTATAEKATAPTSTAAPAAAAAPAAVWAKTVHIKRTQGECTFELDAPEELKESAKDGMSFTLESASLSFQGFDGTDLHSKPEHALDMFHGQYRDVYRGAENGVQLAIVTAIDVAKDKSGKHSISGMGGEPYSSQRNLGCTFICDGARQREADVLKLCKSVRIAVKPAAK